MKKPYQIEAQRAVKQLEAMAAEGNPAVQMVLPMAEMVGWLRKGVGELIRQAGLQLMDLLMQEEVRESHSAVHRSVRFGEERGQRTFHRGEPGEVEGHDGASAGEDTAMRAADRCDAVRRSADGGCVGNRAGRAENDLRHSARSHGERDSSK